MSSSNPEQPNELSGLPVAGDVLAGKYQVERVLGVGGMGAVVAAMHLQLHERVALKFLLPSMVNAETKGRFAREAQAAAKIKSEHIARVTDVGTLETGSPYMVMEFLEGEDLSEVLAKRGALPIRDAVEYVIQACDAVAEAHSLGIVHRDLKPANLFLAQRAGATPRVKVLDFGISKQLAEPLSADNSMTKTRAWLGSPLYMSPEQMRSAKDVDGRTDIWALGLILYELLTGEKPFDSTSLPDLCAMILHGPAPDVEARRPEVPRALGDVIRCCLHKDPRGRFQTVADMVMAMVDHAPRRTLSIAERAVSITEAAGLRRASDIPRAALDATLPEPLMSPLFKTSNPALPAISVRESSSRLPLPSQAPMPLRVSAAPLAGTAVGGPPDRRGLGLPLLLAGIAVGAIGFFAFTMMRGQTGSTAASAEPATATPPPSPPPSPSASAPSAPPPAPSPVVTASATAAAAPSASANAAPSASASASAAAVAPVPTATATASPAVRASTKPNAPRPPKGPAASAQPVEPKEPATPVAPVSPPKGTDLSVERCFATQPDGSRATIPCP